METKHTPEPWEATPIQHAGHPIYAYEIGTTTNLTGSVVARTSDSANAFANAARIVACVNACANFADPAAAIRDNFAYGTDMANTVERLRAINTELVAALRLVRMTPGFDATATYGQSVIDALAKSGAV